MSIVSVSVNIRNPGPKLDGDRVMGSVSTCYDAIRAPNNSQLPTRVVTSGLSYMSLG